MKGKTFNQASKLTDRQTRGERTEKQTGRDTDKGRRIEQTSRLVDCRTMGEQLSREAEWQTNRQEKPYSTLVLKILTKNPRKKKTRVYS
jgi:hypothetical protein